MLALSPALAQSLPPGASAIDAATLNAMFGGKTYTFQEMHGTIRSMVSWYLGANGEMTGYAESGPSYASGTWTASDGKLCVSDAWAGSWGNNTSSDCQLWAANGKKLYRAEVGKGDFIAFSPVLHSGDEIALKIEKLRKKLGK